MLHILPLSLNWLNIILVILLINIFISLSFIFFSRKSPSTTWAFFIIMLFIPFIGLLIFILFGQDLRERKTFSKKEERDRFSLLLHLKNTFLTYYTGKYNNPLINHYKSMIKLHLNGHEAVYTEDNTLQIFADGNKLFNSLFKSIKTAKHSIHIESYIIRDDKLGIAFKNLLIQKAKEGVAISLLYDDVGCIKTSKKYFYELSKAGIKVACFFPTLIPFLKFRANYRNHRKICVIDGVTAYLGGFNIGTEYIGLNKKMGYWRDTHLMLTGSAVRFINLQFLLDFRFATNKDVALLNSIPLETDNHLGDVGIQIVSSGPDSKYPSIRNGYIQLINAAQKSIYIQTPYFIPDDSVITALKLAALSGVDVKIMIPNKPDHMCVYWATYYHIGEILETGVKCYTYQKGFLHAKTIIIDDTICSVGTANFDIRSFKLNFEINAFVYNEAVSLTLSNLFKEDLIDCTEMTKEVYNQRGLIIHFKEAIARLISPIL